MKSFIGTLHDIVSVIETVLMSTLMQAFVLAGLLYM